MKNRFRIVGTMDSWKPGDPRGNQMINIVLNDAIGIFYLEDGSITLTPQLVSDHEIDYYVNSLIADLEAIRKTAKTNIKQTNGRIQESPRDK